MAGMSELRRRDTCGDHGGRTKAGKPCKRKAGSGTPRETGMCREHSSTVEVAAITAAMQAGDIEPPPPGWLDTIRPGKKRDFLTAYLAAGLTREPRIEAACRIAGVDRSSHFNWMKQGGPYYDPEYRRVFEEVVTPLVIEWAEASLWYQGVAGVDEPVIWQGVPMMRPAVNPDGTPQLLPDGKPRMVPLTVKKFNATAALGWLNANAKHKYTHRTELTGAGGGPIDIRVHAEAARETIREKFHKLRAIDGGRNGGPGTALVRVENVDQEGQE